MRLSSSFSNPCIIRSDVPLTSEQIAIYVPSIFADEAHDSRSERYMYIPTIKVLNALREEGFEPFMACQTRVRDEGKRDHTKHMLRLRHASQIQHKEANEIILLNSHDGSSSYQMMAGKFRFVCANGLVVGDMAMNQKVRHSGRGDIIGEVIEGAFEVLSQFEKIDEHMDEMKSLILDQDEQKIYANAALSYRYAEEDGPAPITASQLLEPRRFEDRGSDLWTVYNRVQENVIKGGLTGRNKHGRRAKTRGVHGMDQDLKLNRALWQMAQALSGHIAAA